MNQTRYCTLKKTEIILIDCENPLHNLMALANTSRVKLCNSEDEACNAAKCMYTESAAQLKLSHELLGGTPKTERKDYTQSLSENQPNSVASDTAEKAKKYFELPVPENAPFLCSDNSCPCSGTERLVPGVTGYLYIDNNVIDMRKDALRWSKYQHKMKRFAESLPPDMIVFNTSSHPIFMCELAAKKRGLNLKIALEDAKHWVDTGKCPLRTTPIEITPTKRNKKSIYAKTFLILLTLIGLIVFLNWSRIRIAVTSDQSVLARYALEDHRIDIRLAAVKKLTDQQALAELAIDPYRGGEKGAGNWWDERHAQAEIAVDKLTDQIALGQVAMASGNTLTRSAAVSKLTDQQALAQVVIKDKDSGIRRAAIEKLTDQQALAKVAIESKDSYVHDTATRRLTDQQALAKVVIEAEDDYVRHVAISKLTDQQTLAIVAATAKEWSDRINAAAKLDDQTILAKIAEEGSEQSFREVAVRRLTDQKALIHVAINGKDFNIRKAAVERLTDQQALAQVLINSTYGDELTSLVLKKLIDQEALAKVILEGKDRLVCRIEVMPKLIDQQALGMIAKESTDFDCGYSALQKTTDKQILKMVAETSVNENIRNKAKERLNKL